MKYAFRTLAKTPGLSLVIVLSLAFGIGANTTIFSWLNGAVLRPLPGVTADVLCVEARNAAGVYTASSWLEYRDLVERLPSFAHLIAQRPRPFNLGEDDKGERIWGELVSANFFAGLGVAPARGRFFRAEEVAAAGGAPVAVISHALWRRKFDGRADIVGQTLTLNRRRLTIVGVAPEGFVGGWTSLAFEVWVPLTMATELMPATRELAGRTNRSYMLLGVLQPGVSRGRAEGELAAAARSLAADFPEANDGIRFELLPVWRNPRGGAIVSGALATLQVFAALVLIIVCVNTANLLLARASARQREIGIRLACGAGVWRILRQLLTESVLLALLGAALGALLAVWGIDALRHVPVPTTLPVRFTAVLDWRGLLFAAGTGAVCGILFGLAPALQLARGDVQQALRGGRGSVSGRSRLRSTLVAVEVAVALVVLVLAGLFLKSFHNAQTIGPGYAVDRVLLVSADLLGRGYSRPAARDFVRDALERLRQLPGVEAVAAASVVPLEVRGMPHATVEIDGRIGRENAASILSYTISPGYLATMGLRLVAGEDLAPFGRDNRPADAIVNEEMARRFWPGISPLGHRFKFTGDKDEDAFEVVGIVANTKYESLAETPQPIAWITARHDTMLAPAFHVRVRSGDPAALLPAVREALHALDPEVSVYDGRTFAQHVDNNLFLQRTPAQMLAILAPLALALAAIGIYAVLAYAVAQRTAEIGVRLTLGATPAGVMRLVVGEGMKIVGLGAAAGWLLALGAGWFLQRRLVGVPPGDPLVYLGVPALLLAVAALACWIPARRAARVDPMTALRAE